VSSKPNTSDHFIILGPYPPPYGGVATFNTTLFDNLKPKGAVFWTYNLTTLKDSTVKNFGRNIFEMIRMLITDARKATILDSSTFLLDWPNKKLILILFLLKPLLKCRWIKIVHDGALPSRYLEFSRTKKFFFRLATSLIDEYITVNKKLQQWLTDTLKKENPIQLISSLLPQSSNVFLTPLHQNIKKELSPYPKLIISIGAFVPNYGFREIIQTVDAIRSKSNFKPALILLEGTFAIDPEYKRTILKNRDWIKVYTDISQSQVFQLLKLSDVFVRATSVESYGLSKIESLWCGTPVASTDQGETRGMILFDRENPEQMIQIIEEILSNPDLKRVQENAEYFTLEARKNLNSYYRHLGLTDE